MPKKKLSVVLPTELAETIDRLAGAVGRTRSDIVTELLLPSQDSLTAYADLAEHFKNATPDQLAALVKDAEKLGGEIDGLNSDIDDFKAKAAELTDRYKSIVP